MQEGKHTIPPVVQLDRVPVTVNRLVRQSASWKVKTANNEK